MPGRLSIHLTVFSSFNNAAAGLGSLYLLEYFLWNDYGGIVLV